MPHRRRSQQLQPLESEPASGGGGGGSRATDARGFISTIGWDQARIRAASIYCSDGRFGEQMDEFLHQGLGLPRYDRIAVPGGPYVSGVLPEVQDLFDRQSRELDRRKREELLHQIQKVLYERAIFAPIWENGFIRGVGPRVEEPALALIPSYPYSAPYEDLRLKATP